jgi:hypothetical protein
MEDKITICLLVASMTQYFYDPIFNIQSCLYLTCSKSITKIIIISNYKTMAMYESYNFCRDLLGNASC